MKDEKIFSPFYVSFLRLCAENSLTPSAAARKAGISSGAPTAWKNENAVPKPAQREKLCKLFGVSDEELLGYGQKNSPSSGEDDGRSEIEAIFSQLTPSRQTKLLELAHLYLSDQSKSEETQ